MKKLIFSILFTSLLASCDSGKLWEDEKYAVYWIGDSTSIGIKIDEDTFIERFSGIPFSVGSNEKYLVVNQNGKFYYLEKELDRAVNDNLAGIHGPYSEQEFSSLVAKFNLPAFQKSFK